MKKLLIVEDAEVVRTRLVGLLSDIGSLDVRTAATLAEAMAALAELPDLVSVDLTLPDGSGLELIRRAKALPRSPQVFVLSASSEMAQICRDNGADAFFDKNGGIEAYLSLIAERVNAC